MAVARLDLYAVAEKERLQYITEQFASFIHTRELNTM